MSTRVFHLNGKTYRFDLDKFKELVENKAVEKNTNMKKIELELFTILDGVSYSTVHSWTMRKNGPSDLERIYKIENYFGLEKGELLNECTIIDKEFSYNENEDIDTDIQQRLPEFKIVGFSLGKDSGNKHIPKIKMDFWSLLQFKVHCEPNNLLILYFVKKLLSSGILNNIEYNLFDELIIHYEAIDSLTDEYKQIINRSLMITNTIKENNELLDIEYNAGGCALFLSSYLERDKIYLRLNKLINNSDLIRMLKRIAEEKQQNYIEARRFFKEHKNQFEYICGFCNKKDYSINMLYDGYYPQPEVVDARSVYEAKILFLERYKDKHLPYFMNARFLKLLSEDYNNGTLDKFVKTYFAHDVKILSFVDSLYERFLSKKDEEKRIKEKVLNKHILAELKKIDFSKFLNPDFYKVFWEYHMLDSVYAILSADVKKHIENYIGLGGKV